MMKVAMVKVAAGVIALIMVPLAWSSPEQPKGTESGSTTVAAPARENPRGTEDEQQVADEVGKALVRFQADAAMDEEVKTAKLERRLLGASAQAQADWYIQSLGDAVALTKEQEKAIADIIEARSKSMADFDSKNAERKIAMTAARIDAVSKEDPVALAKARQDYDSLFAPRNEILKRSTEELDKVLTPGQKAKLEESRAMDFVNELTAPAKLTVDQAKQVKVAWASDDGRNRRAVMELLPLILTLDQQATVNNARGMTFLNRYFSKAKLTEEQVQKIKVASEKLSKDTTLGTVERLVKLTTQTKMLLTEEQKEALNPPSTQAGSPK